MTRTEITGAPRAPSSSAAMSWFVALIGAWLVATAFLWNRTAAGRWNAVAVGAACCAVALGAARHPALRWLHVLLAGWLFASAALIAYERHDALWNGVALGMVLLLVPFAARALREEG
jgi:hypothetical protein